MGLSVKVDSATSVAGKTIALVVAYAGVGDKIGVAEGAAAGSIELDAGPDGKLEGLATVCKFVASLASEPVRGQLAGASPEDEAMISEWLARAAAEYGVEGAVGDEKLAELDARLAARSFLTARRRSYGGPRRIRHDARRAVRAMAREKRHALVRLTRWVTSRRRRLGRRENLRGGSVPARRADGSVAAGGGQEGEGTRWGEEDARRCYEGRRRESSEERRPGSRARRRQAQHGGCCVAATAAKAEKDKAKGKVPAAAMPKEEITVDVLDIKVGTITRAWEHPGADKLWVESIDVGEAKERQVVSGLRAFKTKAQMEGARVLVLCNVKKGPLRDELSEGMVMCASDEAHTQVDFVVPAAGAPNGERVRSPGFGFQPVEVLVPKKKMFEACAPKLRTNDEGVACYDGVPFMTSAGACASALKQAFIK